MRERVVGVLAGVLELPADALPPDASAETVPGWDSLRQIELVLALEAEFDVRVPSDAVGALTSLEAIESFLAAQ